MIEQFDIAAWLESRSVDREVIDGRIVYTHKNRSKSTLFLRQGSESDDSLLSELLPWFYCEYVGASIGGGAILIASTQRGGLQLNDGARLPDRTELTTALGGLRMACDESECFFATSDAWMFAYATNIRGVRKRVYCYDRDFEVKEEIESFSVVFEEWWQIVCENS